MFSQVTDWPWVKFYQKGRSKTKRNVWLENENDYIVTDEDVVGTLEPPKKESVGRYRVFFIFKGNKIVLIIECKQKMFEC